MWEDQTKSEPQGQWCRIEEVSKAREYVQTPKLIPTNMKTIEDSIFKESYIILIGKQILLSVCVNSNALIITVLQML